MGSPHRFSAGLQQRLPIQHKQGNYQKRNMHHPDAQPNRQVTLSNGAARVWEWMYNNSGRAFNPTKANVRAGNEAVWKGTAADLAVRAAVYVHCKRSATRCEALFAPGGTTATPATLAEGSINVTDYDVVRALAL